MTEKKELVQPFDMTYVEVEPGNRVAVAQRVRAKMTDGNNPGSELRDVDEVLLANGDIVYQCVSRAGGCGATWPNPRSVLSHLKTHQGVYAARRAQQELADYRAQVEADAAAGKEKRSAVARKAVAVREARKAAKSVPTSGTEPFSRPSSNTEKDVQMARVAAMDEMDRGWDLIDEGRKAVEAGAMTLAQLSRPTDPELVEKAAKWDNMRKMLS